MQNATLPIIADLVRDAAHSLTGSGQEDDPLLERGGEWDVGEPAATFPSGA